MSEPHNVTDRGAMSTSPEFSAETGFESNESR